MLTKKIVTRAAGGGLVAIISLAAQPLWAQSSSEAQQIQELKREVAELKQEVNSLKKHEASEPSGVPGGPTKTEVSYDGKNYVEKSVPLEKSAADKWKLSTSITELELYGDIRLRYQYVGGETQSRGPVASPPANGVAGTNDWIERERERYRLRLGLRGTFLDDWFFGVRLETNNNARSTNVTIGDDAASSTPGGGGPFEKNSDTIYVGQAYGGYKGFPDFTFTGGRMPNPLVNTRMVWDPDINPEGLAEQWKHTFVFGAEPAPPSYGKDSSKDGKAIVGPPPEPFLKLDIFANFGQFVYSDTNPENPLGPRPTTTVNGTKQLIPNTDAFLLAWQLGARFNFPHSFYFQFAPTLYNYTGNGNVFNTHFVGGDPRLTNSNSLATNQTGINSLLVFDVPAEFGWKAWGIPMRIFTDFATNFEANERANAAVEFDSHGNVIASPGPGHGDQRYAFTAGLGIGQLKKKGDWQIDVWYQQIQQFALDPNLIDDDIFNAQENIHGIAVQAAYNFTAGVNLQLTYAHGWWYNHNLGTGGIGAQATGINPTAQYNFFTADLNLKF